MCAKRAAIVFRFPHAASNASVGRVRLLLRNHGHQGDIREQSNVACVRRSVRAGSAGAFQPCLCSAKDSASCCKGEGDASTPRHQLHNGACSRGSRARRQLLLLLSHFTCGGRLTQRKSFVLLYRRRTGRPRSTNGGGLVRALVPPVRHTWRAQVKPDSWRRKGSHTLARLSLCPSRPPRRRPPSQELWTTRPALAGPCAPASHASAPAAPRASCGARGREHLLPFAPACRLTAVAHAAGSSWRQAGRRQRRAS